jgi:hypothetical protein
MISGAGLPSFELTLREPVDEGPFMGHIEIKWSAKISEDPTRTTTVYISRDEGRNWDFIWSETTNDSNLIWDSAGYPDGVYNLFRVVMLGDSGHARIESPIPFTIDNPGNAAPEVSLFHPGEAEVVSGQVPITWQAVDVESADLHLSIEYTMDGETWMALIQDIENTGVYHWDTNMMANSNRYQLILRCSDGELWAADTSAAFTVRNEGSLISGIEQVSGSGGGPVSIRIVDMSALTGHTYDIILDDTSFSELVYHVDDISTGTRVVANATQIDGSSEGPLFDGLRIRLKDYEKAVADLEKSGWETGSSTLDISYSLPVVNLGDETITGYAQPADYRIELFDDVVGMSSDAYGASVLPMKFTVYNMTDEREVPVIFIDTDNNQTLSRLDQIYFVEPDSLGNDQLTWLLFFGGYEDDAPPVPGDVLFFYTLKPFTSGDRFRFTAIETSLQSGKSEQPDRFMLYQNFPNPFNPQTKIIYTLQQTDHVNIIIYNSLGQKITELVDRRQAPGRYSVIFDGSPLASGVYFYRLITGKSCQTRKMLLLQ